MEGGSNCIRIGKDEFGGGGLMGSVLMFRDQNVPGLVNDPINKMKAGRNGGRGQNVPRLYWIDDLTKKQEGNGGGGVV